MDLYLVCNHCGEETKVPSSQPVLVLSCPWCGIINHMPTQRQPQGAILAGYRILHRIQAYGASETYLAEPVTSHTLIKLQTFTSTTFGQGLAAEYYLADIKQWMQVRQPNIVKVLEAGRSSTGTFFAASAPITGITLEHRLWRGGAVDLKAAIYLAISISRVLEWLWKEHGLIYGQLTPRNIILTPDKNIFLAHMALTPILKQRPPGMSFREFGASTPGFTSPEQFTAPDTLDCRGDMYSLGATLYHMLTGKPPFACLNAEEVLAQHQTPSLADPRLLRPDLPDEYVWLLEILLAHDPKDRFDDWDYLIKILTSLDFGKTLSQQKAMKSHSVMIRLPPSDVAKLNRQAMKKPVQALYPNPEPVQQKDYFGIILSITIVLSAVLIIIFAVLSQPTESKPTKPFSPSQRAPAAEPSAPAQHPDLAEPFEGIHKPATGSAPFMALLVETRKFARQNPHQFEEILGRYETLLAMAETNAPRWVPGLQQQVRAIDLAMAAPLDDAEQAIRLQVRKFEDNRQYQAGIDWLHHYSGSFVERTARLRHSLSNILVELKNR